MKRRDFRFAATFATASVACLLLFSTASNRASAETISNSSVLSTGPADAAADAPESNHLSLAAHATANHTNAVFDGSQFHLALSEWNPPVGLSNIRTDPLEYIQSPNGATFGGDVLQGAPNGWGVFSRPDGTRLEGEWRQGVPYRISGTAVLPDGTVETGNWDYVKGTGNGSIKWKNGNTYQGDWKVSSGDSTDVPQGDGTMTWSDGHKFVGRFYNGEMHGWGTMTQSDGKIVDGLWQHGEFVMSRIPR
jgi:hypothetical protein